MFCSLRAFSALGGSAWDAPKSPNQCFFAKRYTQISDPALAGPGVLEEELVAERAALLAEEIRELSGMPSHLG